VALAKANMIFSLIFTSVLVTTTRGVSGQPSASW
jgi:hypothetical protein